jgi:hypothetical protein
MKKCQTCQEEFADTFGFCPVDGVPFEAHAERPQDAGASNVTPAPVEPSPVEGREELHLTFLEGEGLTRRLMRQLRSVAVAEGLTWPDFKRDPAAVRGGASRRNGVEGEGAPARGGGLWRALRWRRRFGLLSPLLARSTRGHERALRDDLKFWLYRTFALFLEAGHVVLWVKLHHWVSFTLGENEYTTFCIGVRFMIAVLIAVNITTILAHELRHLWRMARPGEEGAAANPPKADPRAEAPREGEGDTPGEGHAPPAFSRRTSRRRGGYVRVPLRAAPSRSRMRFGGSRQRQSPRRPSLPCVLRAGGGRQSRLRS